MRAYHIAFAVALVVTAVRVILPLAFVAIVAYIAIRALAGC
jgi:hypothetical protein